MLTLTRKLGEAIRIGDDITIVVKEIRRNHIRISVGAPFDVKIYREEVYQKILEENLRAAQSAPQSIDSLPFFLDE